MVRRLAGRADPRLRRIPYGAMPGKVGAGFPSGIATKQEAYVQRPCSIANRVAPPRVFTPILA